MSKTLLLENAQACFFAGMLKGWAGGVHGTPVPNMPGFKQTIHEQDGLRLVDCYGIGPSEVDKPTKSVGTTTIWHLDTPIWFMSYGGFYEKGHIPFVKKALMHNYQRGEFLNGRGPELFKDPDFPGLMYRNQNALRVGQSDFTNFRASESVVYGSFGLEGGYHQCWGMALI